MSLLFYPNLPKPVSSTPSIFFCAKTRLLLLPLLLQHASRLEGLFTQLDSSRKISKSAHTVHPVRRIRDEQKSPPKSHDGEKTDLRVTNSHGLQGASLKSITLGREGRTRFFNLGSRSIVAFICWAATLMCELFEFTATTHQRRLSPPRAKKKIRLLPAFLSICPSSSSTTNPYFTRI